MELLRERREKFDIVISDVNMPDMDGFKLLEHVGLEMDLPVIMMSVDGETSRVMKGVQHGACDYLLKPIRMKELRNIWQHVYRKRIHEIKEIEGDISEEIQILRNSVEDFDDRQLFGGSDISSLRKRKYMDGKEYSDQELNDTASVKKGRVVWSVDLHQKFVNAVHQIGFDKVGPKKILDLMNVPGLTRENVASHLQKYRLYLSRLQKHNEGKGYGGNMQSDFKEPQASFGLHRPTTTNQNNATSRFVPLTQNTLSNGRIPNVHLNGLRSTVSLHVKDQKDAITTDVPSTRKASNVPPLGVVLSFKGSNDYKSIEPSMSKHQAWGGGIPVMQFMQYPKHDHEPYSLLEDYSSLPWPSQLRQIAAGQLQTPPSIISIACNAEKDKTGLTQIKPVFTDYRSCHTNTTSPVACTIDSISVQVERGFITSQDFGSKYENNVSPTWMPPSREPSKKNATDLGSIPEDLHLYSLQNVGCFENVGLSDMQVFQYNDSTSLTEFASNWYDGLEVNCEYLYDSVDYPGIDDCPFA